MVAAAPWDYFSVSCGCCYLFDIPVEMARSVTGHRHDADVPGLSGDVFEVLARPPKPSFFKRLFGG